ncbi:MAG: DMT family transporter [Bacteroidota bacterium]
MPSSTASRSPVAAWKRIPLGLRYMAGSAFFFSLMALFVKLSGQAGVPSMQIVFARCAVMLVLTYAMLWQASVTSRGVDRRSLFLRGFTGFTALSIFYFALTEIPLGDAATIYNTAPIHTALLAGLFLHERVRGVVVVAIALSLVGVTLIAKPSFVFAGTEASYPAWIVYAALGGAFLSGAAYTFVRKLKDTDHPLVVILWFSWVGALGSLPFALTETLGVAGRGAFAPWVLPSGWTWLWLLMVGVMTHIAQVCLTRGLHLEPAGRASAVGYLQVVFAFVWGLLFFGTVPDLLTLLGAGIVVGGVLLVVRSRR